MRKPIVWVLCFALMLSLFAGCGGAQTPQTDTQTEADAPAPTTPPETVPVTTAPPETEPPQPRKLGDDNNVMGLRFPVPETYEYAERTIDRLVSGEVVEKTVSYAFADSSKVQTAFGAAHQLSELTNLEGKETMEAVGQTFYSLGYGRNPQVFAQVGEDIYAVNYELASEDDMHLFDEWMQALTFDGERESEQNDENLFAVRYSFDPSWDLLSLSSTDRQSFEGETLKRKISWSFGEDADNLAFRFMICVYKNTTLEEKLDAEKEWITKEINGVCYSVRADHEQPYSYYTQQGEDVYLIQNSDIGDGWIAKRTDESWPAFDWFLDHISFAADGEQTITEG